MRPMKFNTYPVQWYEGMLLMPQHFQQADLLHTNNLSYHLSLLNPYHWGIINLKIDPAHLVNGLFRLLELEAILPDGTVVFFPQGEEKTFEIDLKTALPLIQEKPLFVFLTLPEAHPGERLEEGAPTRFTSEETLNIADCNTGAGGVPLARLRPNLTLSIGELPPPRHVALPLAQIQNRSNTYTPTSYIPPQLRVTLTSSLGELCNGLIQKMREKLAYLQRKIQSTSVKHSPEADKNTLEIEEIRRRLVIGLVPFESLLQSNQAHPCTLFKALTDLAGQGVAICRGMYPPVFRPYDHSNLHQSFQKLVSFFEEVLRNIEESYFSIPFVQQDRVYSLELRKEWEAPVFVLGARALPGMREDDVVRWIQDCVIATDSFVHLVRDNRILGAAREIVKEVSSLNLTPIRGTVLFLVKQDSRFIKMTETLRLFNISDTKTNRPQEINLYLPNAAKKA